MSQYSTGLELILNACENALQIVITDDEAPLCFMEWFQPRRAAEILADSLREMCARLNIRASDFRRIACVAGPGSFTGIRLVLTTAAALRRASKAQLASINYLQALATSAAMRLRLLYPEKIFALTHARRDLVHFQEFVCYGPDIPALPVEEVELLPPAEALARLGAGKCAVCGSGLARHPEAFAQPVTGQGPAGAPQAMLLPNLVSPDLDALRLLARHGDYFPKDLEPRYVRECDAIENLPEMARKQGKNGDDEMARLHELLKEGPGKKA